MSEVSVIIPVYNAEKYLAATLDSVLRQTFSDIEVVCINDGSTDTSAEILKEYRSKDSRVKVVTQKNSGGSSARNTGIQQSTGEYVLFLDADDLLDKEVVARAHARAKDTGADIVFYNFVRFVGRPTRMAVKNKTVPQGDLRIFTKDTYAERLFNDFAIITWNKLVKRSVIAGNSLSFDTTLSHNHDVDFTIRLMLAAETYSWLDEIGYYYRSNDSGITATKRSDPTNALRILMNLGELIESRYKSLKPSFDSYVADMVAGTILKYSNDENKVKEVFDFSYSILIPGMGLSSNHGKNIHESTGIFAIVEAGNFEKIKEYLDNPRLKIRNKIRSGYMVAQVILAKLTV